MKKLLFLGILILCMTLPARATTIVAPEVPDSGEDIFPSQQENIAQAITEMLSSAFSQAQPEVAQAVKLCLSLMGTAVVLAFARSIHGGTKPVVELIGVLAVIGVMLGSADSMIETGTQTVWEISEYAKLLLPVMTAALAAQGGTATSAALYGASALFNAVISNIISAVLIPAIYVYLVLAAVSALSGDGMLKKLKDLVKWAMSWFFKLLLSAFTGYIAITGVISGSTDQAALKATKLTISGMVPVVGSVLSDASETVLLGASIVKNSVGVYGLLAVMAVTLLPFLIIGAGYLLLKLTAAVCTVFAPPAVVGLMEDFSSAMGLVLAMVGSVCLIELVSIICFLKGMS